MIVSLCLTAGCQQTLNRTDEQVYSVIRQRQKQVVGLTPEARIARANAADRPGPTAYQFAPHPLDPAVPPEFTAPTTQPAPSTGAAPAASTGEAPATQPPHPGATEPATSALPMPAALLAEAADVAGVPGTAPAPATQAARAPFTMPAEAPATSAALAPATGPAEAPGTVPADLLEQDKAAVSRGEPFALQDCLAYAFTHARDLQSAKEDLYLSGLRLTLERHLWTPIWVGRISSQFSSNPRAQGQIFDRAMTAVADVAVSQRLPYGGSVTARVIETLMSNLRQGVTDSETGRARLEATLPLLRGAGKAAFESRYQAERDLVYAVRTFEQFRRQFAVEIASNYFNLLELRQRVVNAQKGLESFRQTRLRAQAMFDAGRIIALDVQRAQQEELTARNEVIDAREQYELALDEFKVKMGMPATQPIEPAEKLPDFPLPRPAEEQAIATALRMRLDLINSQDQVEDARRRVAIARNGLLPDLNLAGSVDLNTVPGQRGALDFQDDQTTWQAGATLDLPLDRKREINDYRERFVNLDRARRAHELAADRIRLQVRRAIRQIEQARFSLEIQAMNMDLAVRRRQYAELRFQQGQLSNRDVVEAENALLQARNRYAAAQASLRQAILEFHLNTGTLRVDDDGRILEPPAGPA